jgi:hypothetical protein
LAFLLSSQKLGPTIPSMPAHAPPITPYCTVVSPTRPAASPTSAGATITSNFTPRKIGMACRP